MPAALRGEETAYTTDKALRAEKDMLTYFETARGQGTVQNVSYMPSALTTGQRDAVQLILQSEDRVVGVQGHAGTGKTTMLKELMQQAKNTEFIALAPSAATSQNLSSQTGISAGTLQGFLTKYQNSEDYSAADLARLQARFTNKIIIVDEASLIGTVQMRALLHIVNDFAPQKLVLMGDKAQLYAVEAGVPFVQLQAAGMQTALMTDIVRQKNEQLKAAVEFSAAGQMTAALNQIQNAVLEVETIEMNEIAAQSWLNLPDEMRKTSLVLAPTHYQRQEINETIRNGLVSEGEIGGGALEIMQLRSYHMTIAQKTEADNYEIGDVLVFHKNARQTIAKDDSFFVIGQDDKTLYLRHTQSETECAFPLTERVARCFEVYESHDIILQAGDRIRWTRNDNARNLYNATEAHITKISKRGAQIHTEDGRNIFFAAEDPQLRHIDYAYSSTIYAAQGRSAENVIAVLDSTHSLTANQRNFYVDISRAKEQAIIITNDRHELTEILELNLGERVAALDAVQAYEQKPPKEVSLPKNLFGIDIAMTQNSVDPETLLESELSLKDHPIGEGIEPPAVQVEGAQINAEREPKDKGQLERDTPDIELDL